MERRKETIKYNPFLKIYQIPRTVRSAGLMEEFMNALRCDRCGEFFVKSESEPLKTKFSVQQMDRVIIPKWNIDDREKYFEKFDLCEKCTKVFIDLFQKFFQGRR